MENEDIKLLRKVYDKLSQIGIEKWIYKHDIDVCSYSAVVSDLTVEVSSYYGRRSGDNATLKILDKNGLLYQVSGEDSSLFNLYERLEEQHEKMSIENEGRKQCSVLERLLVALDSQGKKKSKR